MNSGLILFVIIITCTQGCKKIVNLKDNCRPSMCIDLPKNERICKGETSIFLLGGLYKRMSWQCGNLTKWLSWDKQANEVHVDYWTNGKVLFEMYDCSVKCVIDHYTLECPYNSGDTIEHAYVYELHKSETTTVKTQRAIKVSLSLSAIIKKLVLGELEGSFADERTTVTEVTYNYTTYGVIPPGHVFCQFREATKIGNDWQCKLPKFKQIKVNSRSCSSLFECPKDAFKESSSKDSVRRMSAVPLPFLLIISSCILA